MYQIKLDYFLMHQYTILILALMIMLAIFAFQMFSTYGFMGFQSVSYTHLTLPTIYSV